MTKKSLNDKLEMDQDTETFLSRWSRKKNQSRKPDQNKAEEHQAVTPELPSGPPDLPDLDDLTESSDFSGFFHPEVDKELRKMALRRLFRFPGSQILDGLNEYDEDYTNFSPRGNIITEEMKRMLARAVENGKPALERTPDPESDSNQGADKEDIQQSDHDT